jgi:PIG-X / PBN1
MKSILLLCWIVVVVVEAQHLMIGSTESKAFDRLFDATTEDDASSYFENLRKSASSVQSEFVARIEGQGMHRRIAVDFDVCARDSQKAIVAAAAIHLPVHCFVDRFELAELARFGGAPAYRLYSQQIDLEQPSTSDIVRDNVAAVYGELGQCQGTLRLPIHLRYREPLDDASDDVEATAATHRQFNIDAPLLFVASSSESISRVESSHASLHELRIETPVGLLAHAPLVRAVTLMTTLTATIVIILLVTKRT